MIDLALTVPIAAALIPALAVANRLRGRKAVYVAIPAAIIGLVTANPLAALAYVGGESFGWGQWLRAIRVWPMDEPAASEAYREIASKRESGRKNGIHALAKKVAGGHQEKTGQWRKYVWAALTIRGLYWWVPVYTVLAIGGLNPVVAVAAMAATAAAFTPSYILARRMAEADYWGRGEVIYGAAQGAILGACLLLDPNLLFQGLSFL
jgi:hypothetical protein